MTTTKRLFSGVMLAAIMAGCFLSLAPIDVGPTKSGTNFPSGLTVGTVAGGYTKMLPDAFETHSPFEGVVWALKYDPADGHWVMNNNNSPTWRFGSYPEIKSPNGLIVIDGQYGVFQGGDGTTVGQAGINITPSGGGAVTLTGGVVNLTSGSTMQSDGFAVNQLMGTDSGGVTITIGPYYPNVAAFFTGTGNQNGGATTNIGGSGMIAYDSTNATLDFPSTTAGTSQTLTTPILGIGTNSDWSIHVTAPVNVMTLASNAVFVAWVSATNTVSIRFDNNNLVNAVDLPSGKYRVTAEQFSK